ncbi:MAG TPA: LysE family transporter [Thermoplasmata archaeon]|nr:LysE family transporter [Thermoplasmata archaeon]
MVFEVLLAVLAGVGIGLSLAAPPGPVNAIIASHTVTRSLRAGILVGLGATTADTIFLSVSVLAHSAVAGIQGWIPFIALFGAGFMVYLAWSTAKAWRGADAILDSKPEERAKSYATGLSVNITSPYPFIWWLTVGLVLIDQLGPAVLIGFFGGLILWITVFPLALRQAQRHIAQAYYAVLLFSIVCLVGFAAWLVWSALVALR